MSNQLSVRRLVYDRTGFRSCASRDFFRTLSAETLSSAGYGGARAAERSR